MLRTVAIIPARSGSKGIIDKNLKLLYGKTLLEWSIEACKKSNFIDQIIVSTDSKKYADLAIKCGADVPFLRPAEISKDNSRIMSLLNTPLIGLLVKNNKLILLSI